MNMARNSVFFFIQQREIGFLKMTDTIFISQIPNYHFESICEQNILTFDYLNHYCSCQRICCLLLSIFNGRFAAAMIDNQLDSWVMNVVPTSGPNTLPVIYDRGLIGVAHDWFVMNCSF